MKRYSTDKTATNEDITSLLRGRREFLKSAGGVVWLGNSPGGRRLDEPAALPQGWRAVVRSGALGRITYCRIRQDGLSLKAIDALEFLAGNAMPSSISAQGNWLVTIRYPALVASYECSAASPGMTVCGSQATLVVDERSYRVFPGEASGPILDAYDWQAADRPPIRPAAIYLAARLALIRGVTLD